MDSHLPSPESMAMNICNSLWQTGFQQGEYSDVNVQVRDKCLALHKVVLARSPYLKSLLDVAGPKELIQIHLTDDSVTNEVRRLELVCTLINANLSTLADGGHCLGLPLLSLCCPTRHTRKCSIGSDLVYPVHAP